jgi:hypothetical protein
MCNNKVVYKKEEIINDASFYAILEMMTVAYAL